MKCEHCGKKNATTTWHDSGGKQNVCRLCLRILKADAAANLKMLEDLYSRNEGLGTEDDEFIREKEREFR